MKLTIMKQVRMLVVFLPFFVFVICEINADDKKIKVAPFFQVESSEGTMYRVSYEYDFPGLDFVYISDIGKAPSKGRLNYVTNLKKIKFMKMDTRELLHEIIIENAVKTMSGGILDIAPEDRFSDALFYGNWSSGSGFLENSLKILNMQYDFSAKLYESNGTSYVRTTYRNLEGLSIWLQAQCAILLTYPQQNINNMRFSIQVVAREKRSHSKWRYTLSDKVVEAISKFRKELITKLEGQS